MWPELSWWPYIYRKLMSDKHLFKDESDGVSFNSLCVRSPSCSQSPAFSKHKLKIPLLWHEQQQRFLLCQLHKLFALKNKYYNFFVQVTDNCSHCDILKKHCDLMSSVHILSQVALNYLTWVTRGVLPNTLATVFEQDVTWNIWIALGSISYWHRQSEPIMSINWPCPAENWIVTSGLI